MSEFQTPTASSGCSPAPRGGEGADSCPRSAAQPFSVVLLDEFEKAHPRIWDVFLQVFDDARLTDRRGATADFRHAVVIMTVEPRGRASRQRRARLRGSPTSGRAPGTFERAVRAGVPARVRQPASTASSSSAT